jgi:hypothetical protein
MNSVGYEEPMAPRGRALQDLAAVKTGSRNGSSRDGRPAGIAAD